MKALIKTGQLLLIALLASTGFVGIFLGLLDQNLDPDETLATVFLLSPVALGFEIWIYKAFLKKWRDVLMNYAIAHFAYFFSSIAAGFALAANLSEARILIISFAVWLPLAYLGSSHILYVERLEAKVKELTERVETFDTEKARINKQITTLKTKLDNQSRFPK